MTYRVSLILIPVALKGFFGLLLGYIGLRAGNRVFKKVKRDIWKAFQTIGPFGGSNL